MNDTEALATEAFKARIEVIREIGFMGYKFLITLNSGAFVVLLTFVGTVQETDYFALDLSKLKVAMSLFLAAIAMTFVSMAIAYISAQFSLLGKSLPRVKNDVSHMAWLLLPVLVSFLLFLVGSAYAIWGIHEF